MGLQNNKDIDSVGWHLLRILQENARMSFRQIGELIGLTAPAVGERIHRLEDMGVIKAYRAEIDFAKAGRPIMAFIHLTATNKQVVRLRKDADNIPEVIECHCVTGHESAILKVAVTSVPHLEDLIMLLKDYGEIRTSLILSTQFSARIIDEPSNR